MPPKHVLFVSGSAGLGHVTRDLAIAAQLRHQDPGVELTWLAGGPARDVLLTAGERLHPQAQSIADATALGESVHAEHGSVLDYFLKAQKGERREAVDLARIASTGDFDVLVGDETYGLSMYLAGHPRKLGLPYAMIVDCFGTDPIAAGAKEHVLSYVFNIIWARWDRKLFRDGSSLCLYVGEAEDVPDRTLGFGLPDRRHHARRYFTFLGYVLPFDPAAYMDRGAVRRRLGYDDRPLIVATTGGTAIGKELLDLCAAAMPFIKRAVPDVRMVLVCGPNVSPRSIPAVDGLDVRGFVPDLYEHLAACDLAVTQGGGTTTMELTALRRPFVYFPLEHHFEQLRAVAYRIARHGAGIRLLRSSTSPEDLAKTVVEHLEDEVNYPPIPVDGAANAARLILTLADCGQWRSQASPHVSGKWAACRSLESHTDMTDKDILFYSGSIGLGHIVRDLAIADALRRQEPGIRISWIATGPAAHALHQAGEVVLSESADFADNTAVAESVATGSSLSIPKYAYHARSTWRRNAKAFAALTASRHFDMVIGDETYEISIYLSENPARTMPPYVLIVDFLGVERTTGSPLERAVCSYFNRLWVRTDRALFSSHRNLCLVVGEPEDVSEEPFGWGLPTRRAHAATLCSFVGWVIPFDPSALSDRAGLKTKLGYDQRPLIVVSVGGTNVGRELLQLCVAAMPLVKRTVADAQMVLVCGTNVSPQSIPVANDVSVLGYVPGLYEHFAACDLAIVQGGGTSTAELTALRRPFLYFPLEHHFEQQHLITERLRRHRAGVPMSYRETTPHSLASAAVGNLGTAVNYADIPVNGAQKAAELILSRLAAGGAPSTT